MGINQIPREHEPVDLPPYFDDFQDYKNFCVNYRGDLARIVKLTAGLLPEQALAAASRRLQNALQQCSTSSTSPVVTYSLLCEVGHVEAGTVGYVVVPLLFSSQQYQPGHCLVS